MFVRATISPLNDPTARPRHRDNRTTGTKSASLFDMSPTLSTPTSPISMPTERSRPPTAITNVCPRAAMISGGESASSEVTFVRVVKPCVAKTP